MQHILKEVGKQDDGMNLMSTRKNQPTKSLRFFRINGMSGVFRYLSICLLFGAYVATPIYEADADGASIAQLLSNIRGSWGPPVAYLKKRGYMADDDQLLELDNGELYRNKKGIQDIELGMHRRSNPSFRYNIRPMLDNNERIRNPSIKEFNQIKAYLDDPYIGENLFKKVKDKWNSMWSSNTTTTRPKIATTITPKNTSTVSATNIVSTTTPKSSNLNNSVSTFSRPNDIRQPWIGNIDESEEPETIYTDLNTTGSDILPGGIIVMPELTTKSSVSVMIPNIEQSDINYMRKYVQCNNRSNNATGSKDPQKYMDNKLKFLANIHHSVYNVGVRKPDHRLDLKAVQEQIDKAKMTYNLNEAATKTDTIMEKSNTKKKSPLPGSLWWPLGAKLSKRSVAPAPKNTYHNDYLDSSELNNSEAVPKQDDSDYPDEKNDDDYDTDITKENIQPVDEEANFLGMFRRNKHKKQKKRHKYRFWKKHHSALEDKHIGRLNADKSRSQANNDELIDFSDIQDRIHPDQQKDIAEFIRNTKAAPQRFDFDVDAFVANYQPDETVNPKHREIETVTEKSFYQFKPDILPLGNESLEKHRQRRDILTQHLKAIANKMHLYPKMRDDLYEWSHSNYNKHAVQNEPKAYKNGNSGDEEDNRYIDHFYLLNDGTKISDLIPKRASYISQLNMDLELDRKFRELNTAKDETFYATQAEQEMSNVNDI